MESNEKLTIFGLPVNTEIMFTDEGGKPNQRIEKRQTQFLEKLTFLLPFLDDDEEILLTTTGSTALTAADVFFTNGIFGGVYALTKIAIFVFTNTRIFHIPSTAKFNYRNSIAQISYADCTSMKMEWSNLLLEYTNGKKEKFSYIPKKEKKKIESLIENFPFEESHTQTGGRTYLCPACTHELQNDVYYCPTCNLEFKNKKKAKKVSLIFPGGGYFYTRHMVLGILDAIVEVFLIGLLILLSGIFIKSSGDGEMLILVFFAIFFLVIEKIITINHSNLFIAEFIPIDKDVQMIEE